jgi:NAD(P)-dependent dehydrogenase (short-subunit alcohol dehydrogenase family)
MSLPSLNGQRVVVIGGTSGIGYAVAEGALAEGASVVVGSSQAAKVEDALGRLGAGASGAALDANDEAAVAAFLDRAGAFDHLVFTAGDWGSARFVGPLRTMDFDAAPGALGVRFWGALKAVRQAQDRIAKDGSITLTSGVLAHRPRPGAPLNTAFAGALEHLVRGLAAEMAPIRVNGVCPGLIMTEPVQAMPQERLKTFTDRQLLPRSGQPQEAAQAYLYLMKGGFTTGQVLVVDGGLLLT